MRILSHRLFSAQPHTEKRPAHAPGQTGQSGAVLLDALHQLPKGYAPAAARRVETAFRRTLAQDPTDAVAQAGLLQILREQAVHTPTLWPHQKRHKTKRYVEALGQLACVLRQPQTPGLAEVLCYADDLWGAGSGAEAQSILQGEVLAQLGAIVAAPQSPEALVGAVLKAFERLSVLQVWCLPRLVQHIETYVQTPGTQPAHIALLPPIVQRALAAPLQQAASVVRIAAHVSAAHPTHIDVLLCACQMLKGVLLPCSPPQPLAGAAIAQLQACATAVPGEAPSYESARTLLQIAESYDAEHTDEGAQLAILALGAVQHIVAAEQQRQGAVTVGSMAERALRKLEQTAQTVVAQAATAQLAQHAGPRRITAPRVS